MSACSTAAGRLNDGSDELKLMSFDTSRLGGDSSGGREEKASAAGLPAMRVKGVGESGGADQLKREGGKRREEEAEAESGLDGADSEKFGEMGGEIILTSH